MAMQRMSGMIAEQQARLRLILSCVEDGLVVLRKDGAVVIANPPGRDMMNAVCDCGARREPCAFHSALAEAASGTPRVIRECGTPDNPIRCDFKIVASETGEEQIAIRLENISKRSSMGDGDADDRHQALDSETGDKKDRALLGRVADAVKTRKPAFTGKIVIEETSDLRFKGVNDEHVVQMLAYLIHQIVCDMNASGIGTEIRLRAGLEGNEPVLWVMHDGPPTDAPASGMPNSKNSNASRLKGRLPLFAELRAVQNGLMLKSGLLGTVQRIEIRKRSSLG